jgi:hypothetical protein
VGVCYGHVPTLIARLHNGEWAAGDRRLEVFAEAATGKICVQEAARRLGMSPGGVKAALARHHEQGALPA